MILVIMEIANPNRINRFRAGITLAVALVTSLLFALGLDSLAKNRASNDHQTTPAPLSR